MEDEVDRDDEELGNAEQGEDGQDDESVENFWASAPVKANIGLNGDRVEHDDEEREKAKMLVSYAGDRVDPFLAPLVEELWIANIGTRYAYVDPLDGDEVCLEFVRPEDSRAFLNAAAGELPDDTAGSLYNRIVGDWSEGEEGMWKYRVTPADVSMDGLTCVDLDVSVTFPLSDLALVMRRLRKHNKDYPRQR